jgi:thioredoxin reductase (NADPH)
MAVNLHDIIIVGGGPAALSAAVYTSREDIETLILEKGVVGGLAAITDSIENYPGFPEGISGMELANNLKAQAERFGAKIELAEVTGLKVNSDKTLSLNSTNGEYQARTVLISTGNHYKHAGVPGEEDLLNRGIHYCATCDGPLYKGKRLAVIGGGNSAAQESLFLAKLASQVDVLIRGEAWKASDVLIKRIQDCPNIKVHFNTQSIKIIEQSGLVGGIEVEHKASGQREVLKVDGVFIFVGLEPNTWWLKDSPVKLDERGFVLSDNQLKTNVPGVYVAGDVRSGATEQIASAVGEGATAALKVREYIDELAKALV